jgi:hypothetical protein
MSMDATDLEVEAMLENAPWNRARRCHGHFPELPPTPGPMGLNLPAPVVPPKWQRPARVWSDVVRWLGRNRVELSCGHSRTMIKHTRRRVPCLVCK